MAESKGCENALRNVTRGPADSITSPEPAPSNMRDCVATMGSYCTRAGRSPKSKVQSQKGKVQVKICANVTPELRTSHGHESQLTLQLRWRPNENLLLGGFSLGGCVGILLLEALDAAGGVHELLLAGEERMAVRANFHAHHVALDSRARLECVAAGAMHGYVVIVGVNTGFHGFPFAAAGLRGRPG